MTSNYSAKRLGATHASASRSIEGEIDSMQEALNSGLPLKESEVVDQLVPIWKTKCWTSTWSSG